MRFLRLIELRKASRSSSSESETEARTWPQRPARDRFKRSDHGRQSQRNRDECRREITGKGGKVQLGEGRIAACILQSQSTASKQCWDAI
jgi:hypothetical protein